MFPEQLQTPAVPLPHFGENSERQRLRKEVTAAVSAAQVPVIGLQVKKKFSSLETCSIMLPQRIAVFFVDIWVQMVMKLEMKNLIIFLTFNTVPRK